MIIDLGGDARHPGRPVLPCHWRTNIVTCPAAGRHKIVVAT